MSLQSTIEEPYLPLVSLNYLSSDEEMEVDSLPVWKVEQEQNVEVLSCFQQMPVYRPQTVGRQTAV